MPISNRNMALDGLRGLAALTVLTFHVWAYARPTPGAVLDTTVDKVMFEGRLGLILFFVLSGYLLYLPFARAAVAGKDNPSTRRYLLRRAARIVPAYYAAIAGSVLLLWGLAGQPGVELPPTDQLPLFFVFAQNYSSETVMTLNQPTWTLAIEASFYLALPLIAWAGVRLARTRARQAALAVGIAALGLGWNALTGPVEPFSKVLFTALPYFAAGMLVAVLAEGREPATPWRWSLAGAGVAAIVLDGILHVHVLEGTLVELTSTTLRDTFAAIGFAAILAAVVCSPRRNRVLAARPLVAVGVVSYGVYLWHFPLLLGLRAWDALPLSFAPALALVLALTLAVAALSWFAIERPAIRWARSRERRRPEPRRLPRLGIPASPSRVSGPA